MVRHLKRINILGVHISPINMGEALSFIDCVIAHQDHQYICVTPAHSIMDAYYDPEFRCILNSSGLTTPDGMAVVWILKLMGYSHVNRVYGPDLMTRICQDSVRKNYRHYLYGGQPGVVEALAQSLQDRFPGIRIAGMHTPPFRDVTVDEDDAIIESIEKSGADIVWVGISSPKQERWMAEHLGKINAPVMIGVGAAFDFLSGMKPQAPRWIQQSGFEWLFRLSNEPRRLWPRYRQYPRFVLLVLLQMLGLKEFPIE